MSIFYSGSGQEGLTVGRGGEGQEGGRWAICTLESENESCLVMPDSLQPHRLFMKFSRPDY